MLEENELELSGILHDLNEGNITLKQSYEQIKELIEKVSIPLDEPVIVKLADIIKILDDEEYTVSVFSNDKVDDKISESIANTAIIDFKKQLNMILLKKYQRS